MDIIAKAATPATMSFSKLVDMDAPILPQNSKVLKLTALNKYFLPDDVSPPPPTNAENARLLLLVSALKKENTVAHQ